MTVFATIRPPENLTNDKDQTRLNRADRMFALYIMEDAVECFCPE